MSESQSETTPWQQLAPAGTLFLTVWSGLIQSNLVWSILV